MRKRLYEIIFEADTPKGKLFDVALILFIITSIILVMIESLPGLSESQLFWLNIAEWILTGLFTIEYTLRIWVVNHSWRYIFSFYGIIDLLAILPAYIGIFVSGTQMLIVLRSLRLIRIFRVFKLTRYVKESSSLWSALVASRNKIFVFLFTVLILIIIMGTVMYLIENPLNKGFSSIPASIYWAVVTLTTVGYGDIAPITPLGKFISGFVMIIGYGIIAVPTGIVTSELAKEFKTNANTQLCRNCHRDGHDDDSLYCKYCGTCLDDSLE